MFSPLLSAPASVMSRCELHGIIGCQAVNKFGSPSKWVIVRTQLALMDLNCSNKHHQGSPPHSPCPRELETLLSSALALHIFSELRCRSVLVLLAGLVLDLPCPSGTHLSWCDTLTSPWSCVAAGGPVSFREPSKYSHGVLPSSSMFSSPGFSCL